MPEKLTTAPMSVRPCVSSALSRAMSKSASWIRMVTLVMAATDLSAGVLHLSPAGRGIGRLWRPFQSTPKRSFGYGAAPGEGAALDRGTVTPHPRRDLSLWER